MKRFRLVSIAFLVVGVVCAGLVVMKFQELESAAQPAVISVLRARIDVPAGMRLADALAETPRRVVRVDDAPAMLAETVPDLVSPDAVSSLYPDARLHVAVRADEFITLRHLEPMNDARVAASLPLPPGSRGMTFSITEEGAVAHLVRPGHTVDVLLIPNNGAKEKVRVIAADVFVVAAGDFVYSGDADQGLKRGRRYQNVTFAAPNAVLLEIQEAQRLGALKLSLPLNPEATAMETN